MNDRIPMSSPDIGAEEEQALVRAIRSGWVAPLGPEVDAFEAEIAQRVGRQHAVALSSGTAALHLGLLGLGVERGDVVLTSSMTFAATANAIAYTGAEPFFIDSDRATGNMNPELLRESLAQLDAAGVRPAAIVPVDLLGRVADYSAILPIAAEFGVPVLSDAAESLGASHQGSPAGSFGQAAVISFNGNKIMTTSGGGMLVTDDPRLSDRARYLATQARQPAAHYEHTEIGYNYRLSNLLAALGRAQLGRLEAMIDRRRTVRNVYRELLRGVDGVSIFQGQDDEHDNCWLSALVVDRDVAGWTADDLRSALDESNIESRPLWKPMHLQPVFAGTRGNIDGSSQVLFETGITLPSGSAMTSEQLDRVTAAVSRFLERNQR